MPAVPQMTAFFADLGLAEYKIASGEDPTAVIDPGGRVDQQAPTPRSTDGERPPPMTDPTVVEEREAEPPAVHRTSSAARPPAPSGAGTPHHQARPRRAGRRPADLALVQVPRRQVVAGRRSSSPSRSSPSTSSTSPGGALPLKYLLPGLLFLIVFQLYTMVFTGFASFTNYGTGHLDDKNAAIVAIQSAERRARRGRAGVPGRPDRPGRHGLDADHRSGHGRGVDRHQRRPRRRCRRTTSSATASRVTGVAGYESLNLATLSADPDYSPSGRRCSRRSTRRPGSTSARSRSPRPPQARAGLRLRRGPGRDGQHRHGRGVPRRPVRGQLHLRGRRAPRTRAGGSRRLRQLQVAVHRRDAAVAVPADHGRGRSSSPSPRRSSTSRSA